jgi:NAD(P) transhydrogenase subunit beta
MENISIIINATYVVCAALFIFGLKLLGHPSTARKGNTLSAIGMLLAIVVTLLDQGIIAFELIIVAMIAGGALGLFIAKKIELTQMPEMVSLLNGIGGLASLLIALAIVKSGVSLETYLLVITLVAIAIGGITFSGSVIAWAKLSGKVAKLVSSGSTVFTGQAFVNGLIVIVLVVLGVLLTLAPGNATYAYGFVALAIILGVMLVIPIGGADMPVVISLLNSYSGLAACATGLAIGNNLLIVAGALVGASGIILTSVMCKAMNRSLTNGGCLLRVGSLTVCCRYPGLRNGSGPGTACNERATRFARRKRHGSRIRHSPSGRQNAWSHERLASRGRRSL